MARVICILNRRSRDGRTLLQWPAVEALFAKGGATVTLLDLTAPTLVNDLTTALQAGEPPLAVVGVGGDGTQMGVLNALHRVPGVGGMARMSGLPPFAVCPFGTGNDIAKSLGLGVGPEHLARTVNTALTGDVRPWDLGQWRDHVFADALCVGMDGEILRRREALVATMQRRPRWNSLLRGYPIYVIAACEAALAWPRWQASIEVDGALWYEGALHSLTLNNCRIHAGEFDLTPAARTDDGCLDAVLMPHLPMYLYRYGTGWRHWPDGFKTASPLSWLRPQRVQGRSFRIRLAEAAPIQVDGEYFSPATEIDVEVLPGAIGVRTPRRAT